MSPVALLGVLAVLASARVASEPQMAKVGPGIYRPIYPPSPEEREIPVARFSLMRAPVTNADFLRFVEKNPKWQRGNVSRIHADEQYLAHWKGPVELLDGQAKQPVTHVSWFAARAYCASIDARLPTEFEWELAASADERSPDASRDPTRRAQILAWYSRPTPAQLPEVGKGAPNHWGIRELHGLVWEWVGDFGNTMVVSDSRESGSADAGKFCGAGAAREGDNEDYATFMRFAFRSSLKAHYTVRNLGFRCAR